jgi:type I restriction enzyme S subunit
MTWPIVKVGELVDQVRGVTYSSGDAIDASKDGYVELLRANNIDDGQLNFSNLIYVPKSKVSDKQYIKKNDIVIAASSGSLSVVGKAGALTNERQCTFGAFCKVLRPNSKVDPRYIANYFQTKVYRKTISSLAEGANINNLRNEHIDNLLISLPLLVEQKRIAAILDKAEEIKRKREQTIAKLDELAQSTFMEMFGDPSTNGKGLKTIELGKGITLFGGAAFKSTEYTDYGIPLIRIGEVNRKDFDGKNLCYLPNEFEKKYNRFLVKKGSLLISLTGTTGKEDYGNVVILDGKKEKYFLNQRVAYIQPVDNIFINEYLHYLLKNTEIKNKIISKSRGVRQANISNGDITSLVVPVPKIEEQLRFEQIIKKIHKQISIEKNMLDLNLNLNISLQNQAFTTGFRA